MAWHFFSTVGLQEHLPTLPVASFLFLLSSILHIVARYYLKADKASHSLPKRVFSYSPALLKLKSLYLIFPFHLKMAYSQSRLLILPRHSASPPLQCAEAISSVWNAPSYLCPSFKVHSLSSRKSIFSDSSNLMWSLLY